MTIQESMTREEVAALICSTLDRRGIPVVLSGGAVVSIYSDNEYDSLDLDFIRIGIAKKVDAAMHELGFEKNNRHWTHPKTPYWVEFSPGPVGIGNEIVTRFEERDTSFGALRLLAPTECVMDRLAAYYHWNDPQAFEQALLVARRQSVDLERIEAWSDREGQLPKFRDFRNRLTARPSG